ncbi:MAG TPA: hypothetical protein PKD32_08650 [Saprospiraceae bacterium]|nr:hypothetical protein [Saprospiraceae bacterium]
MRKIILSCILISLIHRNVSAECPSPIKDTILTINAISQILGYSPKDIIWYNKKPIYLYKITVPNKIYSADQRQKIKYLRKELKKKNVIINETIDTIEKWTVYVVDSAKFVQNADMMKSESKDNENFVLEDKENKNSYSQATIWFSKVNQFFIDFPQGPDEFHSPYQMGHWYPKAKFPIEITHKGILDTIGFEFKFEIPIFFHNNYPAMLQFYHSYYGLWIDRSFERRKRIHVFQRN